MLPELLDIFPDLPKAPDTGSESARFQLFDSTATFLGNAARATPTLVIVDDLQAADTPSILFLQFLASQLHEMSVLVIGTYRDIELTPEHPLTGAIAELVREPSVRVMALAGLGADAIAQYIGAAADRTPSDHLVSAVWRETKGNPLFVGEAVRLLSIEGHLDEVADLASLRIAVPPGIRAVIARRIGRLGQAGIRMTTVGAVLGPEFSLDVLRRIGDMPGEDAAVGETTADDPADLVETAVRAGLLLPVVGARGRYRFSHDLVRETLYDELPASRRVRLHRHIAEVLEALYATSSDGHLA